MDEPSGKRLKTNLPICKTHRAFLGSRVKQNLPAVVEESLCGVSTLLMEVSYRLEALVRGRNHKCKQVSEVTMNYASVDYNDVAFKVIFHADCESILKC